MSAKSRVFSLLGPVVLVATLACADSTAPAPTGAKAPRDTTTGTLADTANCRSGWQFIGGRVECTGEMRVTRRIG